MNAADRQLENQTVLLTGGTGPLAAALATILARHGARVHLAGPSGPFLDNSSAEQITIHPVDLSSRTCLQEVVDQITADHQHIDILINAAGSAVFGLVRDLSLADWEEVFDLNILATINSIELVYPAMVRRGRGHVVNMGSIASEAPEPGSVPFAASKAFVLGLDRSLRSEAKLTGIDLTLILPGYLSPQLAQSTRTVKVGREEVEAAHTLSEISADQFAQVIATAIIRKKRYLFHPKFQARFLWFLAHWFPSCLGAMQERFLKPFRKPPNVASRTHRPPH